MSERVAFVGQAEHPTNRQLRAARAWLRLGQKELAAESGVNYQIIAKYERTGEIARPCNLQRLREPLEKRGIVFKDPDPATHWIQGPA